MATRKTNAKSKTETQVEQKTEGVTLEQALKEEGGGRTRESIQTKGKKPDNSTKTEQAMQVNEKPKDATVKQALKEEGEGRTPETIKKGATVSNGESKMARATKIMEEMWEDIQSGKVKRKDVIKRFMEEVPLSKAGSSTYYGSIKAKLTKTA